MDKLLSRLLVKTDQSWYENLMKYDISSGNIKGEQVQVIIENSIKTAIKIKEALLEKYTFTDIYDCLNKLGVGIEFSNDPKEWGVLFLGLFHYKDNHIELNLTSAHLLKELIHTYGLEKSIDDTKINEVIIFHELFHFLESQTPEIYTLQKIVDYRFLGLFKSKRTCKAASEIAAIHFSKIMMGLNYNPRIYESILKKYYKEGKK